MEENRINQVLVLEDDSKYLILDQGIRGDINYYFVNRLTEDGEDLTNTYTIFEESKIGNDIDVKTVQDKDLMEELLVFFREGIEIEDK